MFQKRFEKSGHFKRFRNVSRTFQKLRNVSETFCAIRAAGTKKCYHQSED